MVVHSSVPVAHLLFLGLDPVAGPRVPSPVLAAVPLRLSLA